jgi:hypothetical protein
MHHDLVYILSDGRTTCPDRIIPMLRFFGRCHISLAALGSDLSVKVAEGGSNISSARSALQELSESLRVHTFDIHIDTALRV